MHRLCVCLTAVLMTGCAASRPRPTTPLTFTYLGVAGWSITDGAHTVVVDPYFSRPPDPFAPDTTSDEAEVARHTPAKVDVVLVGHAHVDHALDAPAVAKRSGAKLIGPTELVAKARAAGLPDEQIFPVTGGEDFQFDGFSVRVLKSLHSFIGLENGGGVDTFGYLVRLSGHEVLVLGTANFIEREVAGLTPNIAIVAPGLREKVTDYACRLMTATSRPPTVLATHFDEWRKPVDTPLPEDTVADLKAFERELKACAPDTTVVVPKPFAPIAIGADGVR